MAKTVKKASKSQSKKPLVSVVMSVYNGEQYLREAIDSILSQTFTDFEFIIINDGSTDGTLKIIKSYKDPRIVLISRENRGLVSSLNEGIEKARGKYVARQDADDVSLPERLKKQLEYLRTNTKCGVVGSRIREINETGKPYYRVVLSNELPNKSLEMALYYCNPLAHGTVLMRTDVVRSLGGYRKQYWPAEDYDLWVRAARVNRIAVIDEVLYLYRFNEQGISLSNTAKQNSIAEQIRRELLILPLVLQSDEVYLAPLQSMSRLVRYWVKHLSLHNLVKLHKLKVFTLNTKKTILLVSTAKTIGGGEVYVRQIIGSLSSKYNFILLAPRALHVELRRGLKYQPVNLPDWIVSLSFKGVYILKSLWLRMLGIGKVRLVHIQQLDDVLTRFFYKGAPIVYTAHSRLQLKGKQLSHVRKIAGRVKATIAVARVLDADLRSLGFTSNQIKYVPNGIEGKKLTSLDVERGASRIVWVGRMEKGDKNPDLLLDIAKAMPQEKFYMYGEGTYSSVLLRRIDEENIRNVVIKGFVKNTKDIYQNAKLLCLTSVSEAMPLVVLEALAAAVPIVSTRVGDVEYMLNQGGGLSVPEPRADYFAEAIVQILNSHHRYAASARKNYMANYRLEKMIASLDSFYEEMVRC